MTGITEMKISQMISVDLDIDIAEDELKKSMSEMKMTKSFENMREIAKNIIESELWEAEYCKEWSDEKTIEISISFLSKDEIRDMNRDFRDIDRETDVLSFPMYETLEEIGEHLKRHSYILLGDMAVCMDVTIEQAREFGHEVDREVIYLFVHSILHLLGYDHIHEVDKKIMRNREKKYMRELGIFK